MNRGWVPATLLGAAMLAMAAALVWAYEVLPPQVASHFDGHGQPDAWSTRANYVWLMTLTGIGLPLAMAAMFWAVRFLPARVINIPHRDHWLAAERRPQTSRILLHFGLWIACLETLLLLGIHALVVEANIAPVVRLSSLAWVCLGLFLAAIGVWLWQLFRQFRLPT